MGHETYHRRFLGKHRRRDLEGATDYVQGSEFRRLPAGVQEDLVVWPREVGAQGDRGDPILKIIASL